MINNRKMIKNLICGAGRDRTDDLLTASQKFLLDKITLVIQWSYKPKNRAIPEVFYLDYLLGSLIIGSFNEPDNSKTIDLPLRGRI